MIILRKYFKGKFLYKENHGFTLVGVLMVLVLLSVLGLSIMMITSNFVKISTGERDDQSVFYIAEAGLVRSGVRMDDEVNLALIEALLKIAENEKKELQFRDEPEDIFYEIVERSISTGEFSIGGFDPHFDEPNPFAKVTVTGNGKNYTIRSVGYIGEKKRTVSRNVQVLFDPNMVPKPGVNNTKRPLNSCFALYTSGSVNAGSGTINGDVYSTKKIVISNSGASINGSIYSTEDIEINGAGGIKNVYSPKNVKIGGGSISGSVFAGESFTISNGTISGDVNTVGSITVTGGGEKINGSAYAGESFTIDNGTVSGDVKAVGSITATGGAINGNAVSKKNVSILNYPKIGKDIIAINDIYVKDWFSDIGGNYRYGNSIKFDQGLDASLKKKKLTKGEIINIMNENFVTEPKVNVSNGKMLNDCTSQIPTLENEAAVFKEPTGVSIPDDKTIPGYNDNETVELIKDGSLNMTHQKTDNTILELNSDIYLKNIEITSSKNLNIDLKGGTRSIYVDSLKIPNGHIKLINPGKLNIYVLDTMNFGAGSSITNEDNSNTSYTNIYYAGENAIKIDGGVNLKSNIHVKDADFTITAGGGVHGDVYVYGDNNIKVSGGSSVGEQLFLASNSKFIHDNGTINGNVVAKNFEMSGGAIINPPQENNDPSDPDDSTDSEGGYVGGYNLLQFDPQIEE